MIVERLDGMVQHVAEVRKQLPDIISAQRLKIIERLNQFCDAHAEAAVY